MSDEISSFDDLDVNELTEEDLAILQAFEAMDTWSPSQSQCQTNDQSQTLEGAPALSLREDDETFLIFVAEAEEDISSIHRALNQLAEHEPGNLTLFITLKRTGHKLRGSAGTIGFSLISIIAAQIELLAQGVSHGTISTHAGSAAITAATMVLEYCLQEVTPANQERESISLLTGLEAAYQSLHIDLKQIERVQATIDKIDAIAENFLPSTLDDTQGFEHLAACTEKLVEQRPTVEDALTQVACALQELYNVQTRLQRLEPLIATLQARENSEKELDMGKYNERYRLPYTLKEVIADLAITTANIQSAFTHSSMLQQDYLVSITQLHRDILLHIPHAHKSIFCLLVQSGDQHILIPFHQIQRISNDQQEQVDIYYSLQELLGFPSAESRECSTKPSRQARVVPLELSLSGDMRSNVRFSSSSRSIGGYYKLLILSIENGTMEGRTAGIVVDEILGEQECIVNPLPSYLQRPSIMGTTIDGKGRVLLIVDLPALIRSNCYQADLK